MNMNTLLRRLVALFFLIPISTAWCLSEADQAETDALNLEKLRIEIASGKQKIAEGFVIPSVKGSDAAIDDKSSFEVRLLATKALETTAQRIADDIRKTAGRAEKPLRLLVLFQPLNGNGQMEYYQFLRDQLQRINTLLSQKELPNVNNGRNPASISKSLVTGVDFLIPGIKSILNLIASRPAPKIVGINLSDNIDLMIGSMLKKSMPDCEVTIPDLVAYSGFSGAIDRSQRGGIWDLLGDVEMKVIDLVVEEGANGGISTDTKEIQKRFDAICERVFEGQTFQQLSRVDMILKFLKDGRGSNFLVVVQKNSFSGANRTKGRSVNHLGGSIVTYFLFDDKLALKTTGCKRRYEGYRQLSNTDQSE